MDKEHREAIKELKNEAGIIPMDEDKQEVLRNSKKPIQRLGQGIHNNCFYYGSSLLYKGFPISVVVAKREEKPMMFLGLNYVTLQCKNCGYIEEVVTRDLLKIKHPKKCKCTKEKDRDFEILKVRNPIKDEFGLNYLTDFNDDSLDYQWQTEAIKNYLDGKYKKKTIKELFDKIVEINKKYIEHLNPQSHNYIACWIIATYCYTLFEQFGRLYNKAERGSGKTKQARVLRFLCHNPMWITKGTESSIFRDMEATCGTLIVDNMDKLHEDLKRAMEHYIETGWMKEATYRLTDKETGRTRKFMAYSSMAINNIYGLDDNTIDKTFEIPMLKSVNSAIKRAKPTSKAENWEEMRNDLRYFVLDNWQEIQGKYAEITASFSGREFDVVEGVLAIAKLIGSDVYQELEKYVEEKIAEEMVDIENNPSFMIFSKIWGVFLKNPLLQKTNVFFGEIADELFSAFHPYLREESKDYENKKKGFSKYIGKIIKSVPMFRKGGLSNGRTYVTIARKDLEQYMKLQHFITEDGNLLLSTTSTTSTKSLKSTTINTNKVDVVDKPISEKNEQQQNLSLLRVDVVEQVDEVEQKTRVEEDIDFSKSGIKEVLENG